MQGAAARAVVPQCAGVDGHVAPAEHALALGGDGALEQVARRRARAAASLGRKQTATP